MIIDYKRYRYERVTQARPRSVALFLAERTPNPFRKEGRDATSRQPRQALRDDARNVEPPLQT
ncbi:hypothetical protein ACWS7L_07600 [Exiguobacterium artemiae]